MNLDIPTTHIIDLKATAKILDRTVKQVRNYVKTGQLPLLLKRGPFFKTVYLFDRQKVLELREKLND